MLQTVTAKSGEHMNNVDSGYGGVFPVADGVRINTSLGQNPAVTEQKYLPAGQSLAGVPLNQRVIAPFQTAPVYYQNHSYDVGILLQQRSFLDYQYQKLQAFSACMCGGAAMIGQLPALQQSLQGHGQMPQISGGELYYQQPVGAPLSFGAYTGSAAPSSLQSALLHLQGGRVNPIIQQLQPFIQAHQSNLLSQLQQNSRFLSFQGYPAPDLSQPQPMVYRFDQLKGWLTTPLSQAVSPLKGYSTNQPKSWEQSSPLYFAPLANHSGNYQSGFSGDSGSSHPSPERDQLWPMFKERLNEFNYPVKPAVYQQGAYSKPCVADLSYLQSNEETQEAPKPKNVYFAGGMARKNGTVLAAPNNSRLSAPAKVRNSPLGRCIEFMEKKVSGSSGSAHRQMLTILFNSWEGQVLFGNRDHLQGQDILRSSAEKPEKYTSESVLVDIASTLKFIDLYTHAIQEEKKPGKVELSKHYEKKFERVNALKEIRQFVAELNPQDPDCAALCRLALQMCGRVRERSMVSQRQLPLCGGFAIAQNAWGEKPLMTTRIMLNLARYQSCRVTTLIPGKEKVLRVPPIDFSRFSEALADKLLLSTLYDLYRDDSSTPGRDAVNASFLGISARPFNQSRWLDAKSTDVNPRFLQAMCQASEQGCPVRGALTGKLNAFLHKNLLRGLNRKANKDNVLDIEEGVSQADGSRSGSHAVIFDGFKVMGERVAFKLYTWGRVYHLNMKKSTFLQHIDKNSFVAFNQQTPTGSDSIFNDLDVEVLDKKSNGSGIILSLSGEEIPVAKGQTVTGFARKRYMYKGNGYWNVY